MFLVKIFFVSNKTHIHVTVFWIMMSCTDAVGHQHFRGPGSLNLQVFTLLVIISLIPNLFACIIFS